MDGTFKTCPGLYKQLFTMHTIINDFVVPLVHVVFKLIKALILTFRCLIVSIINDMVFEGLFGEYQFHCRYKSMLKI